MIRILSSTLTILFLFIIVLGLGGCSKSGMTGKASGVDYQAIQKKAESFIPKTGKFGGTIILSSISDPKSFNPITSTETSTSEFTAYMYEGLVRINGVTLKPEPGLADRWEVSEDGQTWTFHMRPGVVWSDSVPLSAYDVEFTFNSLIFNPAINPNSSRDIFTIDGKNILVKALDSTQVRFTLPTKFAPFLRSLSQEILPKHKYGRFAEKGTFSNALGIQTPPDSMVGSGPFLLEEFISSQKVVFKRNPHYWQHDSTGRALPYLDRVVYQIVTDQNAELLRFGRGELDFLSAGGADYPMLKRGEARGNYTVYRLGPNQGSSFLFFNQNTGVDKSTGKSYVDSVKQSWFRNPLFRRGVAHALDRTSMIAIAMNGMGYPQWSPMTPAEGYFFNPDVQKYEYDPAKARAILAGAGFSDKNNDGILEDSSGHAVEFSLVTNSGNNVRVKIAEMIRKDLVTLGFKIHFQLLEFNPLIQKIDNPPYAWDAILLGLTGGPDPHFGNNVWNSAGSLHLWFPRQKKPSTPWEARIDSLFFAGVKEIDETKRKAVYDEWQRIAALELPLIYTVLPEKILCISNKFGNINPTPNGGLLHNIEQVYLP